MPTTRTNPTNSDDSDFSDFEPVQLLPVTFYTPGQGDPKMEGPWRTYLGDPMTTREMHSRGEAEYMTGAVGPGTKQFLGRSGMVTFANGEQVPVRFNDYGPGVKSFDFATETGPWAKNVPRDYSFAHVAIDPEEHPDEWQGFEEVSAHEVPRGIPVGIPVARAKLALTPQEESTLDAPEGSPQRAMIDRARPLGIFEIPSRFAGYGKKRVDEVVADSLGDLSPEFVPEHPDIPRDTKDIGTRSLDEAFKQNGLLGAGTYIGSMSELPYVRDSAKVALRAFPSLAGLFELGDRYSETAPGKVAKGIEDGLVEMTAEMSSPANLALLASGQALPGTAGKVLTGWFMAQMARQFPEQWRQFRESNDLTERTNLLTQMALNAGIIYAGSRSLVGEERIAQHKERRRFRREAKAGVAPPIQEEAPKSRMTSPSRVEAGAAAVSVPTGQEPDERTRTRVAVSKVESSAASAAGQTDQSEKHKAKQANKIKEKIHQLVDPGPPPPQQQTEDDYILRDARIPIVRQREAVNDFRTAYADAKKEGRDWGIPNGLVEDGLHSEYPGVAQALDMYTHDQNKAGIRAALSDPQYPEYYDSLQMLLKKSFGEGPIPVVRVEGYAGGTGEGVGEYASVSYLPEFGDQNPGKRYFQVKPEDVMFAGNESEGELIVRKSGLDPIGAPENVVPFEEEWAGFEEPSPGEQIRMMREYQEGLLNDVDEHLARGGDELFTAIRNLGGMRPDSGHFSDLREEFRKKAGFANLVSGERVKYSDLFRKGAMPDDKLVIALREQGFDINDAGELADLVKQRSLTGRPIYGDQARAQHEATEGEQFYGMGAAHARERLRPNEPTAKQLSDMIKDTRTGDPRTFAERLAEQRKAAGQGAKDKLNEGVDVVRSLARGFKRVWWDPPTWNTFEKVRGRWDEALQYNDRYITELGKHLEKAVPSRARQEAIYNWSAADGDIDTLHRWADKAPADVRQGYLDAQHLNPDEQHIGNLIRSAYDEWFERAQEEGMLTQGVENYLKRVVKVRPEIESEIMSNLATGRFSTNFREAKHRFYDEMVDAERKGVRYDKRLRTTSLYAQSFEHAAINRKFARQLFNMDLDNGRPAMITSGSGIELEPGEGKPDPTLLVTPYGARNVRGATTLAKELLSRHPDWSDGHALARAKEIILKEYVPLDHPAFENWNWVNTRPDGTKVFVKGDALVHKSIAGKLQNAFVDKRVDWAEPILKTGGFIKGSKLSLSLFHQAHEIVNAWGHLTRTWNLKPLDTYLADPEIKRGMASGLKLVPSASEQAYFMEGMGSHGWPDYIPIAGKYVQAYKEWLFGSYIPRLKAQAYLNGLKRNVRGGLLFTTRGKIPFTDMKGTRDLTPEQNRVLTARQINATFGELNYRQMMRDPRLQQVLQGIFLAPDFGEAKVRHMGQAFTRYGGEQRMAIGLVAASLWIGSRLLNQAFSGNPHFDKPFAVVIGDRQYTIRSLPGDMYHAYTDPRNYIMFRLSPIIQNIWQTLTKRDARGNVVGWSQVAKDWVLSANPIPLTHRQGLRWSDNLASAMGVTPMPYRYETELHKRIADWRKNSKDPKLVREQEQHEMQGRLPSMYQPMRDALRDGNLKEARDEYQKLLKTGSTPHDVSRSMHTWANAPMTGSKKVESRFKSSLNKEDMELYNNAKKERKYIYSQFQAMERGADHQIYPEHLENR